MVFISFKQYQAGLLFCFLAHVCWNSLSRGEGTQIQRKLFHVRLTLEIFEHAFISLDGFYQFQLHL